jgi:hypothetical protein
MPPIHIFASFQSKGGLVWLVSRFLDSVPMQMIDKELGELLSSPNLEETTTHNKPPVHT